MSAVPTVALTDLQTPTGIAGPAYATAVEALAVALSRHGAVVLRLPGKVHGAVLKGGLAAMLAGSTRSLPGCELREWRVGGLAEASAIEEAYGTLESAARLVLSALCRSSLLRLRADAFSGVLDDLPLSRSTQGSSTLTARQFLDNFSHLPAAEGSATLPLFADPQDAVVERGLLSLFYCQEAREGPAGSTQMSAMQVQDSGGRWQDVQLGPNEVAVLLGHTMEHATAGLLRASVHRVVGSPYAPATPPGARRRSVGQTAGRTTLQFELRPRPAAVLDLRPQLEAAGHTISARFSPMSVSSLLEQFESLLSPASKVATPDQQQGAAAHAAWEEMQATLKKGRKRASGVSAAGMAVTGNPNARSSAEGLGGQQQRPSTRFRQQQQQDAHAWAAAQKENAEQGEGMHWEAGAQRCSGGSQGPAGGFSLGSAAAGAGPSSAGAARNRCASLEPAGSAPLVVVRGRTCTVVDGCLADDPAECITVCVRSFTGLERWFYINAATRCGAIFEVFCARLGISLGAVKFLLRGERVFGASTPLTLTMHDGDEFSAVPESSDRLQQQRELGPLFAAVFGSAAAAAGQAGQPDLL